MHGITPQIVLSWCLSSVLNGGSRPAMKHYALSACLRCLHDIATRKSDFQEGPGVSHMATGIKGAECGLEDVHQPVSLRKEAALAPARKLGRAALALARQFDMAALALARQFDMAALAPARQFDMAALALA
eukprot:357307-Chlamydomonas_euryale.AAC.1